MAEDEQAKEKAGRFNYGVIKFTDVPEETKVCISGWITFPHKVFGFSG